MQETMPKKPRRGIYLLPNLFTTACLFSGVYAIVSAISGDFGVAALAIFIAMVMDGLDGRVARMTNTATEFGVQYDSLADMVSFGVAPAIVVYLWAMQDMGKVGWLVAFIYTAGAALRLARFNTQVAVQDKRFFQGLPSPAAAALIAGAVGLGTQYDVMGSDFSFLLAILTAFAGVLMVSNFRFYSFKEIDLKGKVPFVVLLAVVLVFVFISIDPPLVLFSIFLIYAVSGPVVTLVGLRKRRAERRGLTDNNPEDNG
jgi:CDP-diacylglycerol--serine O-phosphatidyltransferase